MSVQLRDHLESLAVAGAVTGEQGYGERLRSYLTSLVTWSEWTDLALGVTSNLDTCHLTMGAALADDVVAPSLPAADRAVAAGAIERLGLAPLADALASRESWRDDNFLMLRAAALTMGGLVLLGESERAADLVGTGVQALAWYVANRRTTGQQEGYQCTSFSLDNLLRAADAVRRVTGNVELLRDPYLDATSGEAAGPSLSGGCCEGSSLGAHPSRRSRMPGRRRTSG